MNNKKRILVLTNIYPADDTPYVSTSVVHYFTKEWVKMGYEVRVIHNNVIYLRIFYFIASIFRYFISTRVGYIVPIQRFVQDHKFKLDGVSVLRLSIFKLIPHTAFAKKRIRKQVNKIICSNHQDRFVPDVIISHWVNPQLEIMTELKKIYGVKTCLVIHSDLKDIRRLYPQNHTSLLKSVDVLGFRSVKIKKDFVKLFGEPCESFICHSGIPKEYVKVNAPIKIFKEKTRNFLFVGTLIKRKCPECLIYAISDVYKDNEFHLSYIGRGGELRRLQTIVRSLNLDSNITFKGLVERNEVQNYMMEAECFIMVSRNETFGLVYLEAMAAGCITVVSSDGAFNGIVKEGYNGFICKPGDREDLKRVIKEINSLSLEKKKEISRRAWETAKTFTDLIVARNYIDFLCRI